jgi:hypothetical protein
MADRDGDKDKGLLGPALGPKGKAKAARVFHEWGQGALHSGQGKGGKPGPVVNNQKQAVAIALSEGRKASRGIR